MSYPLRQVRHSATVDRRGHVLVVQTAPREPEYLSRTLVSLERAGAGRWEGPRLMVADGYAPEAPEGWRLEVGEAAGQARTFFRALRLAAAVPGFSALTLIEDDVVLARNALDYIATVERDPNLVLQAWFTWQIRRPWNTPIPLFLDVPLTHQSSNVAVTLSAERVHELLASDVVKHWTVRHSGDIAYLGVFAGGRCGVHFPSLVQHVGDVSTVGSVGQRVARHFLGEAQDAMRLLAL